ncbi:hypothetical protein BLA29_013673, partial [Euroglyphus maynei]
ISGEKFDVVIPTEIESKVSIESEPKPDDEQPKLEEVKPDEDEKPTELKPKLTEESVEEVQIQLMKPSAIEEPAELIEQVIQLKKPSSEETTEEIIELKKQKPEEPAQKIDEKPKKIVRRKSSTKIIKEPETITLKPEEEQIPAV